MSNSDGNNFFFYVTLPFVFCIFCGFVFFVFWTGWSTGISRHNQINERTEYAAAADKEIEERCLLLEPVPKSECIREIKETTNEHDRSERDIVAQNNMALWAAWMSIISGFTAFVSIVGIYYIRQTLMETRRIGRAEVRAYVGVSSTNAEYLDEERVFKLKATIKNTGQTPAINLRSHARIIVDSEWKDFPNPLIATRNANPHALGANLEMPQEMWTDGRETGVEGLRPDLVQSVLSKESTMWVWVMSTYEDVFEESRHTISCLELYSINDKWDLRVYGRGTTAT